METETDAATVKFRNDGTHLVDRDVGEPVGTLVGVYLEELAELGRAPSPPRGC